MKNRFRKVWNIIRNYKWKSIFINYFRSIFLILFVPVLILTAGLMYFYHYSSINDAKRIMQRMFWQNKSSVENVMFELENLRYAVLNNKDVAAAILNSRENLSTWESIRRRAQASETMRMYIYPSQMVDSMYVYSVQSEYVISTKQNSEIENFSDKTWYDYYKRTGKEVFVDILKDEENSDGHNMIRFVYPLSYSGTTDGLIIINIRCDVMENLIEYDKKSEEIYIINEENNVVFSTKREKIGNKFEEFPVSDGNDMCEVIKGDIVCSEKLENIDLILAIKSENLYSFNTGRARVIFICYIIMVIIAVLIISSLLAIKFYMYLGKLITAANITENMMAGEKNEIQYITDRFLKNAERMNDIEKDLSDKVNDLKKSQQIALQIQIAPHFILNTLNLVNLLLLDDEKPNMTAIEINSELSKMLVNILNTSRYIVTIGEEIEYTKKFIKLEQTRKQSGFDVIWHVDERCTDLKTVKFILQPIIENSIFHGIKNKKNGRGIIEITIECVGDNTEIVIKDNGEGMTPERFTEINNYLENSQFPQDKNIGVLNVNKRIKIVFGNAYGCRYIKSDNEGTVLKILLPGKE